MEKEKLDESFKKDAERWVDSYKNHSATALHKKAVAGKLTSTFVNGFSIITPP